MVRIAEDLRRCVVFLGHPTLKDGKPNYEGTGFLVEHEEFVYLVTAKHVADNLFPDMLIVMNDKDGNIFPIQIDDVPWKFHPDAKVDAGAVRFEVNEKMGCREFPSYYLGTQETLEEKNIGPGDLAYVVGLFHIVTGHERISPIVHTSHVAMLPAEQVPVKGFGNVEAYLVEAKSPLGGLSGSPVFVRKTVPVQKTQEAVSGIDPKAYGAIWLLGMWQADWTATAEEIIGANPWPGKVDFPFGMGVIVPAQRIIELLNHEDLMEERKAIKEKNFQKTAAQPRTAILETSTFDIFRPANVKSATAQDIHNPGHREDFNRLLDAAVRERKSDDQT
ncbi:MAG: hypothetical protein IIA36_07205 [Proteobacteria bacterium]|nr:hypothetical protein [Pseudomonadota bacterium]